MSIYGPIKQVYMGAAPAIQQQDIDLTPYAKKSKVIPKTGGTMSGDINMDGNTITNLKYPTDRGDAATTGYVSSYATHLNKIKVNWTGGTMTGDLDMGSNKITNVGNPVNETDVVNKQYAILR
jgi:hypothetical protein